MPIDRDLYTEIATVRYKASGMRCSAHIMHRDRVTYISSETFDALLDRTRDMLEYLYSKEDEEDANE
jgi:hypothetical protein